MSQSIEFMNALKKLLKLKGIVYQDLAEGLGLSLPSIKRLFSSGDISLNRLDKICEIANIDFSDLLKLMELSKDRQASHLTQEQENFLSDNLHAMAYLELFFLGYTPKKIQNEYGLTEAAVHKTLRALDRHELIEWLPKDKVKLKVNDMIKLRPDSKLSLIMREKGVKSFLNNDFQGDLSYQEFMTFKASKESIKKLNSKLRILFHEVAQEGIMEGQAGIEAEAAAVFTAVRPWRLVEILGIK
ncbi:MAG TPA: helix-turn-helix transcriptional regulator [Bacteriovoracaceae bacterium]|nr:helix-turn-helix transcriptional regulator [Bacteriovoracaceae bacterium]